ncbi:hypothetical protein [Ralstonia insidiosa]|jgi:hypothetical protein|uniref:Uncharacterized protein n=2 Tax=Ralstonia TaxID=48736 RepID=A0AAD2BTF7_9RALS|nr:hypothetical protein [Ralstonia insidiosa]NMV39906.1 hypothetical protein [Ralstonia insidiosa]CAJ0808632.1 hypothetical protein R77560_04755 [Ralstonia sp. LMG 18095]
MSASTKDREVGKALRSLISDSSARSETARLREIFDDVEATLQSGVRREAVLTTLHDKGFTMTMASFKSALQRIRKERKDG